MGAWVNDILAFFLKSNSCQQSDRKKKHNNDNCISSNNRDTSIMIEVIIKIYHQFTNKSSLASEFGQVTCTTF